MKRSKSPGGFPLLTVGITNYLQLFVWLALAVVDLARPAGSGCHGLARRTKSR